ELKILIFELTFVNSILTRCSVFKDQAVLVVRPMSQQQLLYYIMSGVLMSSSLFNFFFSSLALFVSRPEIEYTMDKMRLQVFLLKSSQYSLK
ncbi:hypothetical protein, partial [Paenibacillus sp. NPDC058177]|uniref:hypothetical protein n=1 Tax=Paenibacillus sp. NPDC058177 TaxID=3346369 RepID=UPI0036D784D9